MFWLGGGGGGDGGGVKKHTLQNLRNPPSCLAENKLACIDS